MKKRFLSLLMAFCLMLTLVPAAFAAEANTNGKAPLTVDLSPDDIQEVDLSSPMMLMSETATGVTGTGTATDPYCINDIDGFVTVAKVFGQNNYYGEKHFKLMCDINLNDTKADEVTPSTWGAYIRYFHGTFDGNGHKITGIPENCYLFLMWHDGEIKNLEVELEGKAATLVYSYFTVGGSFGTTYMSNVTVRSNPAVDLKSNDQANYAPFLYCTGPYFTMENCTNYADISGVTYASVFYGYNPMPAQGYPTDAKIEIKDCVNHGDLNLRYTGLVFGNPTYLNSSRNITITGLKNYGQIRGTESKHYFCSDAGNNLYTENSYYKQMEDAITTADMTLTCGDPTCPHKGSVGGFYEGTKLAGLGLSVDPTTKAFVVTAPTSTADAAKVDHYLVTVSAYVSIYSEGGVYGGSNRVSCSELILKSAASLATAKLFDYALTDGTPSEEFYPSAWIGSKGVYELLDITDYTTIKGYWLDNTEPVLGENWHQYINKDKTPGSIQWDVYVTAYNSEGQMLDTVCLVRS